MPSQSKLKMEGKIVPEKTIPILYLCNKYIYLYLYFLFCNQICSISVLSSWKEKIFYSKSRIHLQLLKIYFLWKFYKQHLCTLLFYCLFLSSMLFALGYGVKLKVRKNVKLSWIHRWMEQIATLERCIITSLIFNVNLFTCDLKSIFHWTTFI